MRSAFLLLLALVCALALLAPVARAQVAEAEAESEGDWLSPALVETLSDADASADADVEAALDVDAGLDADVDAALDAELDAEAEATAEAEAELEADAAPGVQPEPQPAAKVEWEKPAANNIDHRDHRRVHVTLMAQHLDMATEHSAAGNGVSTLAHVAAAEKHNTAAVMHQKADQDPDFVKPAIRASRLAYEKSRSLLPPNKTPNMVPNPIQSTPEAEAALKEVNALKPNLAPEAIDERQQKRTLGKNF